MTRRSKLFAWLGRNATAMGRIGHGNDDLTNRRAARVETSDNRDKDTVYVSQKLMSECYDLKVIADSADEVRTVLDEVRRLFGAEPFKVEIGLYPKFPRMWQCTFEIRPRADDPLKACAERFARLATPTWDNRWRDTSRPREHECYEAISDARRHLFSVDRVFWARVYCEARVPPTGNDANSNKHL